MQTAPPTFIREGREGELLRMSFRTANGADEILVNVNGNQAEKLFSDVKEAPALFVQGSEPMTVANLVSVNASTRIELGIIGNGQASVNALTAPAGLTAYILNSRTGHSQPISAGTSFAASEGDQMSVIFRQGVSEATTALYAYRSANAIQVVLSGNTNGSVVEVIDAAGKLVSRSTVTAGHHRGIGSSSCCCRCVPGACIGLLQTVSPA